MTTTKIAALLVLVPHRGSPIATGLFSEDSRLGLLHNFQQGTEEDCSAEEQALLDKCYDAASYVLLESKLELLEYREQVERQKLHMWEKILSVTESWIECLPQRKAILGISVPDRAAARSNPEVAQTIGFLASQLGLPYVDVLFTNGPKDSVSLRLDLSDSVFVESAHLPFFCGALKGYARWDDILIFKVSQVLQAPVETLAVTLTEEVLALR